MKTTTVTTREAQHNLAQVLRRVEQGERIEVLRRKKPIAHIVPIRPAGAEPGKVDWSDLPARLEKIWHGRMAPGHSTDEILDDLRGER
ncbi:MAG: type II toxin-antitoxin system prevent-host-death family antitoxin [Opitutales bacterium]|nr:type II toxin-antitoxin system prevent-host-death family antitoxin [Opitutales bacterium]